MELNSEKIMIDHAKHAVGLDYKKPYNRHGKAFYKPYRNFYCTRVDDKIWTELKNRGYAKHDAEKNGIVNFFLTRKGLDWLGKKINIIIHDCN